MKNETLVLIGWVLLMCVFLAGIIMGPIGLHNLSVFQENRNLFIDETMSILQTQSNNVSEAIRQLESTIMKLQYGLNVSNSVSMIVEGTIRWQINSGSIPVFYENMPADSPNSTYRTYATSLYGLTYYVVALDPILYNGPLVFTSALAVLHGMFDSYYPFAGFNDISTLVATEYPKIMINTTACPFCIPSVTATAQSTGLSILGQRRELFQVLTSRPTSGTPIHFTLQSTTQFLFFK